MRIGTSIPLTTSAVLGIAVGIVGIAGRRDGHVPQHQMSIDVSPSVDLEFEPSGSTATYEPPPPPELPFYSSLFVVGKTWTLPCTFGHGLPSNTQRCRVESVEVTTRDTSARIGCWYVHDGEVPDPAVNTYVMTATGLYKGDTRPSTNGQAMFSPYPVPKSLPKGWGEEEPSGPTWANAIIHHHDAWCTDDEFQSLDTSAAYTECISRRGIVGLARRSFGGMTERCGDVPTLR